MKPLPLKRIDELIESLRANDKKRASELRKTPEEPRKAMNELAKAGRPVVGRLLELLNNKTRFSCLYAIKVLGEIGDPSAVQPILKTLSDQGYLDSFSGLEENEYLAPAMALRQIGLPALEPTLAFLKERMEQDDDLGVYHATRILAGIKDDRSFVALVNLLPNSDSDAQTDAIVALAEYGDKRAVEHLEKLLENDEVRHWVLEAIRKLVSVREYRRISEPYVLKDIDSFVQQITSNLRSLKSAHEYPDEFEGDDADEFNSISQERKIHEAVGELLSKSIDLGGYEAAYTSSVKEDLERRLREIRSTWSNSELKCQEEIDIISGHFPEDAKSEMTKSYKGLIRSSFGPNPKIDELLSRAWKWLKKGDFLVTKHHSSLWARKGARGSRKGCYVVATRDEKKPRTWGIVRLTLWGNGWTAKEMAIFRKSFWDLSEKTIADLVGVKQLQIQIIKD